MNRLKQLRIKENLRQRDIAAHLGITSQAYGNYETGRRRMDPSTLNKLADYFDISVDFLICRSDNPNYEIKMMPNTVILIGKNRNIKRIVLTDEKMKMLEAIINTLDNGEI